MKIYKLVLVFVVAVVGFIACNKREIIPPPSTELEFENSFIGKINGSTMELTQNVGGYTGSSDADLIIDAGGPDKAVYYSTLSSSTDSRSMSVGHGSIFYDANAGTRPALDVFEDFFTNSANLQPDFSTGGLNGFKIRFRDVAGRQWDSNENGSWALENAVYTNMRLESDGSGDYMMFRVDFEGYVYRSWSDGVDTYTDSLLITDAVYKGWYKR